MTDDQAREVFLEGWRVAGRWVQDPQLEHVPDTIAWPAFESVVLAGVARAMAKVER